MKAKAMAYGLVMILVVCVLSSGVALAAAIQDPNITLFGVNAGSLNSGLFVTFIGDSAGFSNSGTDNTFVGDAAGQSNTIGEENTFTGSLAGGSNTEGNFNTFMGAFTGSANTIGTDNTFIGDEAGSSCIDGKENTFVGSLAGLSNIHGDGNVFLGLRAGSSETGSNKLYIDNCFFVDAQLNCTIPLIYGEFDHRIVALPDGKLGIGTATPQSQVYAVDLTGTNVQRGMITAQHSDTATAAVIQFKRSRGAESAPLALDSGDNGGAFHSLLFDGSNYLLTASIVFKVNGTVTSGSVPTDVVFFAGSNPSRPERMRLTSNGDLGIGTSSPTHPLEVCGVGGCSFNDGGTTWVNASSREFKENIQDLSAKDALDTLKDLNPVTFTYKTMPEQNHVGFIAEDVPDLVAMRDRKGLSAMDIVAVLTKVVQEQKQTIEAQQKSLKSFEVKLAKLESEVNRLKSKDMTAKAMNQD